MFQGALRIQTLRLITSLGARPHPTRFKHSATSTVRCRRSTCVTPGRCILGVRLHHEICSRRPTWNGGPDTQGVRPDDSLRRLFPWTRILRGICTRSSILSLQCSGPSPTANRGFPVQKCKNDLPMFPTSVAVTIKGGPSASEIKPLPKHKKNPEAGERKTAQTATILLKQEDAASFEG
jgi:hypothetical protein